MLLIGLTGGIGSGKTFISKIINSYKKFKIFDSDFEAKKIIKNNPEVISSIKNSFGPLAYVKNNLNKKYISEVVFSFSCTTFHMILSSNVLSEMVKQVGK